MLDSIFWVAFQSSLFLGLIHGINPCGHSWLVLAPFVYGEKKGKRVVMLTAAFISGTSLGCLAIGLTLGSISMAIPASFSFYVDMFTFGILLLLGAILIVKPGLLHSHDHNHDDHEHDHHDHEHDHSHHHCSCSSCNPGKSSTHSITVWGLFSIGFINMIVPCPTVAIMYTYAINSGNVLKGTMVFASYAVGTALALATVIFIIYKAASFARSLEKGWIEPLVMRTAGVLTIAFAIYSLYPEIA